MDVSRETASPEHPCGSQPLLEAQGPPGHPTGGEKDGTADLGNDFRVGPLPLLRKAGPAHYSPEWDRADHRAGNQDSGQRFGVADKRRTGSGVSIIASCTAKAAQASQRIFLQNSPK